MSKIVLEDVSYVYGSGTPFEHRALDHVSISVEAGRITGIIGHTGSGKSTMMQLLNGLASPTSGKVLLDGYDIGTKVEDVLEEWMRLEEYAKLPKHKAKRAIRGEIASRRQRLCFRVGLVMQYPEYQLFEESVFKDIAFGPRNMGLSEDEITQRVYEAAKFVGLDQSLMHKSPFDLSGGQKRRVALAGVIAMRPEVLVLDEPAAGLDPQGRDFIFEGICEYQRATGSTVLIVSHSMEDMARYCEDMIVMCDSRVMMSGDTKEVFAHVGELSDIGLDIPQITRLMQVLRARGFDVPENVYTVDDAVLAMKQILTGREVRK